MALLTCDFFSDALGMSTSMTVVLPQGTRSRIGLAGRAEADPPVLYLLHGLSDDHTTWTRHTSLERYAAPLGLAVVMPSVARSFYADEVHGDAYWTFLTEELPEVVASFLRVSSRREDTFVAGLSMGGYGALRWALSRPERFAAVASLSGALDVVALSGAPDRARLFETVFGGTPGPDADLFALLRDADVATLPAMHLSCGTEDLLLRANQDFAAAARDRGLEPVVDFRPGEHEWGFWDAGIQDVLSWLPLRDRSATGPQEAP